MAINVRYSENKPVDEGFYRARLDGLDKMQHAQFGAGIKWTFTILEPVKFANSTVTTLSSTKASPKSKLFQWLAAGFGIILGPEDQIDLETLLGKTCRIRVKNNVKKIIVEGEEREMTYSNVDAIAADLPQTQVQPQQTPPQQPQAAPQPLPQPQSNVVPKDDLAANEDFDF